MRASPAMDPEQALKLVKLLEKRESENISEFEYELLNSALVVLEDAKRDSLKANLYQQDVKKLSSMHDFLANIDVEKHADVGKAQEMLQEFGYYEGEIDSLYGELTKTARAKMSQDIMYSPGFIPNMIIEQAKGLFETWE
jgi:hypothetical protein